MITLEELRSNKLFREYKKDACWNCDLYFAITPKDENNKKKYILCIRYWDWRKYPNHGPRLDTFDIYVSLFIRNSRIIRVEFSLEDTDTVQSILDQIEDLYKKLDCVPDRDNND